MLGDTLRRLKARSKGRSTPRCALPSGHSCAGGWHLKWEHGWKSAYERCGARQASVERIFEAKTFATFEAGREDAALDAMQRFARLEATRVVLAAPRSELSGLIPKVTTGCGKTHLLMAAKAELEASGHWVCLVDCARWQRARWGDEGAAVRESWAKCDVLLVDHLGREMDDERGLAGQLSRVIDQRVDRPLAVATDLCRGELVRRYGEAFASRLYEGALVPELDGRDYRQKNSGAAGAPPFT